MEEIMMTAGPSDLAPEMLKTTLRGEMSPEQLLLARMDEALELREEPLVDGRTLGLLRLIEDAARQLRLKPSSEGGA